MKKGEKGNSPSGKAGRKNFGRLRLAILTGAFLVIAVNPFLNYFLHIDFIQGWYQSLGVGRLWFVSPLEGMESLLITRSAYGPSIIGMIIPLLIAFYLGRVFCSWVCPVSFLLELLDRMRRRLFGKPYLQNRLLVAKRWLWATLIGELVVSLVLGAPLFVFLSPPGLIGREMMMAVFFGKLALEGVLILLIIFLDLLTRRFFCRTFCPLGGLLAFVGRRRSLRVEILADECNSCGSCAKVCPIGLKPDAGEGLSAYCWNCGECIDSCHKDALRFRWL